LKTAFGSDVARAEKHWYNHGQTEKRICTCPDAECTDEPPPWAKNQSKSCAEINNDLLPAACSGYFQTSKFCAKTCKEAGHGYLSACEDAECTDEPPTGVSWSCAEKVLSDGGEDFFGKQCVGYWWSTNEFCAKTCAEAGFGYLSACEAYVDATGLQVTLANGQIKRCSWIANKHVEKRCEIHCQKPYVAAKCALTCSRCVPAPGANDEAEDEAEDDDDGDKALAEMDKKGKKDDKKDKKDDKKDKKE